MAAKITSDVLESYIHCKFKGHLKLAGQQGTKCDFEAMLMELRAEVRLQAVDMIIARYSGDQVARNIPLTTAGLKRGPQYILDGTLEDDTLALHFDGLKAWRGSRSWVSSTTCRCCFTRADKSRRNRSCFSKYMA